MEEGSKYRRLGRNGMKKMDLNKIFSMFSNNPEEELRENLVTYKNSPKFKLEMFTKLILNGVHFKDRMIEFFSNSNVGLERRELSDVGDFMMFTRAWFWIQQFKLDDPEWVEDLNNHSTVEFEKALKICIQYFEDEEEFEKCSFLVNVRSLIKID